MKILRVLHRIRSTIEELSGQQTGMALVLVLVFLALGSLTIVPVLNAMATGIGSTRTYEEASTELYAADAGIEDALWQIMTYNPLVPNLGDPAWSYNLVQVNGNDVNVNLEFIDGRFDDIV